MVQQSFYEYAVKNKPVYSNGSELKINFKTTTNENTFLFATHTGWICPSMYNDSPPNAGLCDIDAYSSDNVKLCFTSDDYAMENYLCLEVIDNETLKVVKDKYFKREGTILKLCKE